MSTLLSLIPSRRKTGRPVYCKFCLGQCFYNKQNWQSIHHRTTFKKIKTPATEETQQSEFAEIAEFETDEVINVSKPEGTLLKDSKAVCLRLVKRFHPDLEQDETLKIKKRRWFKK